MPEENKVKRNWIERMVDIFHKLELNTLYTITDIRKMLRTQCNDAISLPTIKRLIFAIMNAQESGLQFIISNKLRKLVEKKTVNENSLFELIEIKLFNIV